MDRFFRKSRIWLLIGLLLASCHQSPSGPPFDPHIEDVKLIKLIAGDAAIKAINELHGKRVNVVRGFVAHYEGAHDKATIWVSEAPSDQLANRQLELMIEKMKSNRKSPFSNYRDFETRGIRVVAFDGMAQVHYVFTDNTWVYWISADERRIDTILKHIQKAG